jgi:SNF2-related domain
MIRNPYAKQIKKVLVPSAVRPNAVVTVLTDAVPAVPIAASVTTLSTSITTSSNDDTNNTGRMNQMLQHPTAPLPQSTQILPINDIPTQCYNASYKRTVPLSQHTNLSQSHQQRKPPPSTVATVATAANVTVSTAAASNYPVRPSSSSSSASTLASTSSGRNTIQNSIASTTMIDRYHNTLPPEIRFPSQDVAQPVQDEYRTDLIRNAALTEPLLNGWTLYSHQKRAVLVSLLMRRHILALDMGLGKTLIGCCWARAFVRTIPNLNVVIICPVSLKEEWYRTAHDVVGLSFKSDSEYNQRPKKKTKSAVTSDDNKTTDGAVTIHSWAKIPYPEDILVTNRSHPYVVIADEAHSMQSMNSARTSDALRLMLAPNAMGVLLLTGTPVSWHIRISTFYISITMN